MAVTGRYKKITTRRSGAFGRQLEPFARRSRCAADKPRGIPIVHKEHVVISRDTVIGGKRLGDSKAGRINAYQGGYNERLLVIWYGFDAYRDQIQTK